MKTRWTPHAKILMHAEQGVAAIEAALIFPLLLTLLLGIFDMGRAILANTKVVHASQVIADLITRSEVVTTADLDEAIEAGRLALEPLDTASYGIDIVSIQYDGTANGSILWRETRNMSIDTNVLSDASSLADPNTGVVVVNVQYRFEPFFVGFVFDDIQMNEAAFARGRRSEVVERQ